MCEQFVQTLMISLGLFCNTHTGEECELTCRDNNSDVVILLSNMTADSVRKEHWRNPPKVKVCVSVTSPTDVLHKALLLMICPIRNLTLCVCILVIL